MQIMLWEAGPGHTHINTKKQPEGSMHNDMRGGCSYNARVDKAFKG